MIMSKPQLAFERFYQQFFYALLRRQPVTASFMGRHEYDCLLPDYSAEGCESHIKEMREQLNESRSFAVADLTDRQRLDKKLLEGYLETQLWEYSSQHFHRGNPSLYTGEAVFGMLVCILTDYAPAPVRYKAMAARMRELPAFFAQAKENLQDAPVEWTKRAIAECTGGIMFLEHGLQRAADQDAYRSQDLWAAVDTAMHALVDFKQWLEEVLLHSVRERVSAGEEALQLMMDKAHFAQVSLRELLTHAQVEVDKATEYLNTHATDFGASSVEEALAKLCDLHPDAEGYLTAFADLWNQTGALARENDLATWPDFPIEYINQHEWAKECARYLYFLFYRAPAAFNRPRVMQYLVPPLRPGEKTSEETEAFLRANNYEVIKNNHVVHHGSLGHHLQNYYAYQQNNSLIGVFAGCDAALRPVMLSAGTMIEGWAVYATKLVGEYGFHTPLEAYAGIQSQRRMAARAVVDIKLHCGEFTLEEAAAYYRDNAGMSESAAMNEAVKNSMFPGAAVIYLYGCDVICDFREEVRLHMGTSFSLGRFHDDFLSYGSIPVTLVCEELRRRYGMVSS